MSGSLVRARLLASPLVGFRSASSAAGWDRAGSAKVGSNPSIIAPSTATVIQGEPTTISGVRVTDTGPYDFRMTLSDTNGLLSATGTGVSGAGTTSLVLSGTIAQVNADLGTLTDTDANIVNDTINLAGFDNLDDSADPRSIAVTVVACYLRGTMIATPQGERPIESLAIGDLVLTADGEARPIRWIGYRAYKTRFAHCNPDVIPVRIAAGAIADGVPSRDLFVSPLHAMSLDGVLVQAVNLVNGVTIATAMPAEQIEYFHIELAGHAVLLANGAPSESFVDDDSRMMFHNALDYAAMYPNAPHCPAVYCAPRVEDGPQLEAIRRRIAARIVGVVLNRAA